MKTNESAHAELREEVIDLGTASIETKGSLGRNESTGSGGPAMPGISEE
jgi:hypothetical protein